ncbi:MAG: sensor histidine kinase [Planctomycetota bacterium]|jgi:signal transduction histidine kinase
MKLGTLIGLVGIASTSVLFVAMAIIIYIGFPAQQETLLQQRGWVLADNLRCQIEPKVLTDDRLRINEIIKSARLSDRDIEYVFVLDAEKKPIASTLPKGVPGNIVRLVAKRPNEKQITNFFTEKHSIVHFSIPLMDGDIGSVHFGINRDSISAYIKSNLIKLTLVFMFLVATGLVMAMLIGRAVAKPLDQVTKTLKQASGRWPKLEHVKTGPTKEVKEFIAIFRQMLDKLEETEQNRLDYERKLLVAERLASTGQLAAEIAHEINNPLDGMIAIARHFDNIADQPEMVNKYVGLLKQGLERIGQTGRQLLNLSRKDVKNYKQVFDIRDTIINTIALLDGSMKKRHIVVNHLCKRRYLAIGNNIAIGQVIMNLLLNAADAMTDKGGRINLEVTSENGDVLIVVTDEGPGISEEESKKIFEPFFSTKTANGGTGLGLSVSRSLVQKCGGQLLLAERKTQNGGAKFVIKLKMPDNKTRVLSRSKTQQFQTNTARVIKNIPSKQQPKFISDFVKRS